MPLITPRTEPFQAIQRIGQGSAIHHRGNTPLPLPITSVSNTYKVRPRPEENITRRACGTNYQSPLMRKEVNFIFTKNDRPNIPPPDYDDWVIKRQDPVILGDLMHCDTSARCISDKKPHHNNRPTSFKRNGSIHRFRDLIGPEIAVGSEGIVVQDKKDANSLIKFFHNNIRNKDISNKVSGFNLFYGEGAAERLGERAIVMRKIHGKPLSQIHRFKADANMNFLTLLEEMISKGVPPSDFSDDNFLYDYSTNKFSPIDLEIQGNSNPESFALGTKYILSIIQSNQETTYNPPPPSQKILNIMKKNGLDALIASKRPPIQIT